MKYIISLYWLFENSNIGSMNWQVKQSFLFLLKKYCSKVVNKQILLFNVQCNTMNGINIIYVNNNKILLVKGIAKKYSTVNIWTNLIVFDIIKFII
jgi:hypothetical protein